MARLFQSGFEENSTTAGIEWSTLEAGAPTIQTTTIHDGGTYALEITSLASATAKGIGQQFSASAANGPFYFRTYFRYHTLPTADNYIIGANGSPPLVGIKLTSTGTLKLISEGSVQVGSASAALTADTWYCIELLFDNSPASGSRKLHARINGVEFAGSDTQTLGTGINFFRVGGNLASEAQTVGDWFFDDVAINDGTGLSQNSYPGASSGIAHLRPNAAGDNNGFLTQVGGTTGSANNFTRVNEVTPDDATSYNASKTLGLIDDFNINDTPAALLASARISAVAVGVRWSGASASSDSSIQVRCKKAASGTVSSSSGLTQTATAWTTNASAAPHNYPLVLYNDPDGAAWTKATLDTAQIGYTISTGSTNNAQITNVWLSVDYLNGSVTAPSNMALQATKTSTAPSSVQLFATSTRTAPANMALQATMSSVAVANMALQATLSKTAPVNMALQATNSRSASSSMGLQQIGRVATAVAFMALQQMGLAQTSPAKMALQQAALNKTAPSNMSLMATVGKTAPANMGLQATIARNAPAAMGLQQSGIARTAPAIVALQQVGLTESAPASVALRQAGSTCTAPVNMALTTTAARSAPAAFGAQATVSAIASAWMELDAVGAFATAPASAALRTTQALLAPANMTLEATDSVIAPTSLALLQIGLTPIAPASVGLLVTNVLDAPASVALGTTSEATATAWMILSAGGTTVLESPAYMELQTTSACTAPVSMALEVSGIAVSAPANSALRATATAEAPAETALGTTSELTAPVSMALGLEAEGRSAPASVSLQATSEPEAPAVVSLRATRIILAPVAMQLLVPGRGIAVSAPASMMLQTFAKAPANMALRAESLIRSAPGATALSITARATAPAYAQIHLLLKGVIRATLEATANVEATELKNCAIAAELLKSASISAREGNW